MNIKECFKKISYRFPNDPEFQKWLSIIEQEIERLEIANKNNEGLVRDNVKLINRNLELEKHILSLSRIIRVQEKENEKFISELIIKDNFIDFVKKELGVSFYHTKHSRYYTIQIGNRLIDVSKGQYNLFKELFADD